MFSNISFSFQSLVAFLPVINLFRFIVFYVRFCFVFHRTSSSDSDRIPRTFVYTPVKQKAARSQIQPENFQPEDYGLEDDRYEVFPIQLKY